MKAGKHSVTNTIDKHYESRVGAIIVAAGNSHRMGDIDKIFVPVLERPLIYYSLKTLHDSPQISEIVLILAMHNIDRAKGLVEENDWHKLKGIYVGGERRQDSVRLGLNKLQHTDWTIVHDGARPNIDSDMIVRGIEKAHKTGAAVAAVPALDTIKKVGTDNMISGTLNRRHLWIAQTPQIFETELLAEAHRKIDEDVTDDASMVEALGTPVAIFHGSNKNIKVTTQEDITVVEALLKAQLQAKNHRETYP